MKNKSTLVKKVTRKLAAVLPNEAAHPRKVRLHANLFGLGGHNYRLIGEGRV